MLTHWLTGGLYAVLRILISLSVAHNDRAWPEKSKKAAEFLRSETLLPRYSSTTSLPFIFRWPMPQYTEHLNSNVPALSAVNSMVSVSPFLRT
jgi:hypothetical protein